MLLRHYYSLITVFYILEYYALILIEGFIFSLTDYDSNGKHDLSVILYFFLFYLLFYFINARYLYNNDIINVYIVYTIKYHFNLFNL